MKRNLSKKFSSKDLVEITRVNKEKIKARIIPRPEILDKDFTTIKLESGYNIGLSNKEIKRVKLLSKEFQKKLIKRKIEKKEGYPLISIIHTGGTVSSKVDYKTGGVVSSFEPEDILKMFPELENIANIKSKLLFQMFSEDMEPEHWLVLAKEIENEIKENSPIGIIITHGTDTLSYTAAALSFMLQDLPIPVILVGSQRSVDRGSSDAALNLICAAQFITQTKFAGVAICMHATSNDDYCLIHQPTKVRKMHTSRRDTFRSIDVFPYAKVFPEGKVEFLREDYPKKEDKKLKNFIDFNKNVAILYVRPGFNYKELMLYKKYKGIILAGTGLGHAPVTHLDKYTKDHRKLLDTIKIMGKKTVIAMTSQCIYGRVNMNVYSTGRELQQVGVLPLEDMLPEVAYVKLGWLLTQYKDLKQIKCMMLHNYAGEITKCIDQQTFLI